MPRHALLVDDLANTPGGSVFLPGWAVTRVEQGRIALGRLRTHPSELLVVGRPADLSPASFVRAARLDHPTSLIPLVQIGRPVARELRAEPDAWVDPHTPLELAIAQAMDAHAERLREGVRAEVSLVLPGTLDQLELLSELLDPWILECGFNSQSRRQLALGVHELVSNSIEWGHRHDPDLPVHIDLRLDREKVSILIRDCGPGFDRDALPHAARPGDPLSHLAVRASLRLREGGFGILMTRGMVDHLCYNEAGNEAHLVKYLPIRSKRQRQAAEAMSP